MNFNTYEFLFLFFPALLTVYFLFKNHRVHVILVGSLIFYGFSGVLPLFLLITTILWGYYFAFILEKKKSRCLLALSFLYPLGVLFSFKYLAFSFRILGQTVDVNGPLSFFILNVIPAGISFYTFQIMSYIIDVYKAEVKAEKNLVQLAAFSTFFSQLIAGPIMRYNQLHPQLLKSATIQPASIRYYDSFVYIATGLFYKIVFSDILFTFHEPLRLLPNKTFLDALYDIFSYSSIIYFDFWGYSLMAIGFSLMMGIEIPRNFLEPYRAKNPRDFWRRWHVTLSNWIKDYVYIPLGGSNLYVRNILIVFIVCGLWHGAGLCFVAWGLLHAFYLLGYHLIQNRWDRLPSTLQVFITYLLVSLAWPLFYNGFHGYIDLLKNVVTLNGNANDSVVSASQWVYLGATLVWIFLFKENKYLFNDTPKYGLWKPVRIGLILGVSIMFMSFRRSFIYFQF